MQPQRSTADHVIAEIADRQHGVVTHEQLLEAGITTTEIRVRRERGGLLTEYRGVYRVGHRAPSTAASYLAAVRAGGDTAVLSGRGAAHLHRITKGTPPAPEITITRAHRISTLKVRRVRSLHEHDRTEVNGIPTTTIARTLVDLAAVLSAEQLGRVVHEASVIHRTTPKRIDAALARRPNSRGAATLRRILHGDERITLSGLERRFLAGLRKARLPLPETNKKVKGRYLDCRWPSHKLTVELDSYRYHATRHAWEKDRAREREAYARGDAFRRYTWNDVTRPRAMLAELRQQLPTST